METIVIDGTTEQGLAAYEPFRAQLAEMKATNANAVFHYETPKGNAAARSHIYGIRKVRAALESARKDAKAFFLEQGRKVDSEAKEIQSELDAMIAVHETPLLEIEEREKARVAAIRERIAVIVDFQSVGEQNPAKALQDSLVTLLGIVVDETFEEFKAEATGHHAMSVKHLTAAVAIAEAREAAAAELERLRAEEAARQQKEREDRIAAEAAAKAKADAEAKAKADAAKAEADARAREKAIQDEADRKEREARAAQEKAEADAKAAKEREAQAERDRIAAAKQAEADKAAAVKAEQDRQAAEAARIERERLAREADKKHRAEVIGAAEEALGGFIGATAARDAIAAIVAGQITNVKVVF